MLNHTVRLINKELHEAIAELKSEHVEPDCVITHINKDRFDGEITIDKIKDFGELMYDILVGQGHIYLFIDDDEDLGKVFVGMQEAGLNFKNILTIPIVEEMDDFTAYLNKKKICITMKVVDIDSAYWAWFNGTLLDSYRILMQLSTEHAEIILDPYLREGDIGEVAIKADRHYIGITNERNFFDIERRLDLIQE
jgi:hypothetical protein